MPDNMMSMEQRGRYSAPDITVGRSIVRTSPGGINVQERPASGWLEEIPDRTPSDEHIRMGPRFLPAFLPWFDPQQSLGETQEQRLAYRKMLADPYIKAALFGKLLGVMALDLNVHPASDNARDKEIAEFVDWNLNFGLADGVPGIGWNVLSGACVDGYSVCDKIRMLQPEGKWKNKLSLRRLKPKDVNNDFVPVLDEYRNVINLRGLRYNAGQTFNPRDFLIYVHMAMYGNPGGMSDMRAGYGSYWSLDTVKKLRLMGASKRAMPIIAGEWPHPKYQNALETALAKISMQNWLAVPADVKLQVLDIAGQSDDYFKRFRDDCVEEIFLSIEGAYLQAMAGGEGKHRGSAKSAENRSELFKWHLATSLASLINDRERGLIPDMVDWNYAAVEEYPRVTLTGVNDSELATSLQVDEGLGRIGWQFDVKDLEDRYGRPWAGDRPPFLKVNQQQPGGMGAPGGGGAEDVNLDDLFGPSEPDDAGGGDGGDGGPVQDEGVAA